MLTYSNEHKKYLQKLRFQKFIVIFFQIFIIALFIWLWELLAQNKIINTFLYSSPSKIITTINTLYKQNNLFKHINITLYETIISFSISSIIGLIIGCLLWWNKIIEKIFDPYLTVLNSLPKVALGPLIIIWVGANTDSIIFMALLITVFTSIINIYVAFTQTNNDYITLLKSFGASKRQIFFKIVLPYNKANIINTLKINMSMSLVGVIMGELLVSKKGLGYLIMYGSQVFNINLVITSTVILSIMSLLMYYIISYIEKN